VPHRAREAHKPAHPLHLTLRARAGLMSLRGEGVFGAVREAIRAGSSEVFRVLHFSVQSDHVHLIVEAEDDALGSGAAGLAIRLARAINRALGRRGAVWGDRYHVRALRTPRGVRHALIYVLMNFRKHRPWDDCVIDPCSSAGWFDGFREHTPRTPAHPPPVCPPRTWLAAVGWRRQGPIDVTERPISGKAGKIAASEPDDSVSAAAPRDATAHLETGAPGLPRVQR
jgi:putative transposase